MPTDQDRRDAKYNRFYLETINGPLKAARSKTWLAVAFILVVVVVLCALLF